MSAFAKSGQICTPTRMNPASIITHANQHSKNKNRTTRRMAASPAGRQTLWCDTGRRRPVTSMEHLAWSQHNADFRQVMTPQGPGAAQLARVFPEL